RYDWFEELRKTYQCTQVAVAHHQNDQVETLLLNLTRGSGIRGLRGMLPKNGSIIRPLLCVTRQQIAQYAHERQIPFVEDSTNADTTIKRNKIRALLSHFSDSEIEHIAQNCQHTQQYITFLEQAMQKYMPQEAENGFEINTDFVFSQPDCAEMILFESLQQFDFPTKIIPDICLKIKEKKVGRQFFAPNYVAEIRQNHLLVSPLEVQENEPTLQWVIRDKQPAEAYPQADAPTAFLDARKITQPLTIRHWQHGDTFKPLGMRGKRKVSDIFTDLHFSHQQKRQQWLVCHGNDIVWMVGYRINEQYKITSSTTQICVISVS
ncbi:MAG: tRNA lysidine(34) synthetase TilS, partial [Paludibacteraceae bacterium]|nr:tRNA lysidine(34) synthetase TilS [Paludibacteraceae bacterium]